MQKIETFVIASPAEGRRSNPVKTDGSPLKMQHY
jgi:hypothetical protein